MNITIEGVPKELHERLQSVADETGRSITQVILIILERALVPQKTDRLALLQRIRARSEGMDVVLDDSGLDTAIKDGRE